MTLPTCKVVHGHVLDVLRATETETVQCCVTSPPYWGLRDYDVPPAIFGGRQDCAHEWEHQRYYIEKTAAVSAADAFSEPGEANAARLKAGRWRLSWAATPSWWNSMPIISRSSRTAPT